MGDIADWMLEGGCCQICGVQLDGEPGYPRMCPGCLIDDEQLIERVAHPVNGVKCDVGHCKKRFKTLPAMKQHARDKHGLG